MPPDIDGDVRPRDVMARPETGGALRFLGRIRSSVPMRPILLTLLVFSCAIAVETPDEIIQRVGRAAQQVEAMRFRFTQVKRLQMFAEPLRSSGVIEIDRLRGRLRWQYEQGPTLILADARVRRWGADGAAESTTGQSAQAMAAQLQAMASGDWSTVRNVFDVRSGEGVGQLLLTPKDPTGKGMAQLITGVLVTFRADGTPAAMRLEANGGDVTEYAFDSPDTTWRPDPMRFAGP